MDLDLVMLVAGWYDDVEVSGGGWDDGDDVDAPGVGGFMYEY